MNDIRELISSMQEENLILDFKTINSPNLNHKDDKRNLARCLSGFANSSGGLVIWGVLAKKNTQGIDCASSLNEIEDVRLFLARLTEFTGMAVSPIVDDVKHRCIETSDGKGIVVTHIPSSASGPHMAKMGEDRYYKRSGDSLYRLEHFDLEDMFGRRPRPELALYTRIERRGLGVQVIIGITNLGRGGAKAPYIAFDVPPPFQKSPYGLNGNGLEGMKKLPSLGTELPHKYGEGSNLVVHPNITHEVALLYLGLNPKEDQKPTSDLVIDYEIAAEGFPLTRSSKTITLTELGF